MKYYIMKDLNDPNKTKVEQRNSGVGAIAEVPESINPSEHNYLRIDKVLKEIIPAMDEEEAVMELINVVSVDQAVKDQKIKEVSDKQDEANLHKQQNSDNLALIKTAFETIDEIDNLPELRQFLKKLTRYVINN